MSEIEQVKSISSGKKEVLRRTPDLLNNKKRSAFKHYQSPMPGAN